MKPTKLLLVISILLATNAFSQTNVPLPVQKELIAAEANMFSALLKYDNNFWKNKVHKDYVTINADGNMQTKEVAMADAEKRASFEGVTYKILDRKIKLYGNVAIINGRSQYFMKDQLVGDVYHTEIWIKEKGKWLFNGWQGTLTKEAQQMMMKK